VQLGSSDARTWTVSPTRGFQDVPMAEPFDLPAGPHTLAVRELRPGVRLDRLLLERLP